MQRHCRSACRPPWLLLAALLCLLTSSAAAGSSRELPERFRRSPFSLMSLSVGYPNDGWQVRAVQLKARPYLKIKSGSTSSSWGHPALVKMLLRNGRDIARSARGSALVVGDLSARGGGPLGGHASHQSGRDADVAFYMTDAKGRCVTPTKFVAFGGDGKAKDGSGLLFDDWRNWLLVQHWLTDHRAGISHIFVSRPLRARLIAFARARRDLRKHVAAAELLLKQPEDSTPHDDHFHVRIRCPKRQQGLCHEHPR